MNHALLYVMPRMRWIWCALMPFLLLHIKCAAWNQRFSLMWLDSKIVPTVTVNWRLQGPQR